MNTNNNQKKTLKLNKTTIMKLNDEMMMRIEGGTFDTTGGASGVDTKCTTIDPEDTACKTVLRKQTQPTMTNEPVKPQTC